MIDINTMILAFLLFLPLSVANGDQHKAPGGQLEDEHKHDDVAISGRVRVYLHYDHPEVVKAWVLIKLADPAKISENEVLVQCGQSYILEPDLFGPPSGKGYTCPYTIQIKNYDKQKMEKIQVGAKLDEKYMELHVRERKSLIKKQGTLAETWSKPLSIPENHEINFVLESKEYRAEPAIYLEGPVKVDIEGVVHLKLQERTLFFSKYYKVPDHVMVWVKPEMPVWNLADHYGGHNLSKPTAIESKKCTTLTSHPDQPHECRYSGSFYVREEGEHFQITAQVRKEFATYGPKADYTPEQPVPKRSANNKFNKVMDFVLDFTSKKCGTTPVIHLDKLYLDQHKQEIREIVVKQQGKKA